MIGEEKNKFHEEHHLFFYLLERLFAKENIGDISPYTVALRSPVFHHILQGKGEGVYRPT